MVITCEDILRKRPYYAMLAVFVLLQGDFKKINQKPNQLLLDSVIKLNFLEFFYFLLLLGERILPGNI